MSVCSKCGSPVAEGAIKCASCGFSRIATSGGTLNPSDLDSLLQESKSESLPKSVDSTSTSTTPMQEEAKNGESTDQSATLNSGELKPEETDSQGTVAYSESMLKEAVGSTGGSGSEGRLKRVWDAAIGSSGKDSKQSLRYERPEASDSVFKRVATRNVSDANSEGAEEADYQIRDKVGEGAMGIVYSAIQTAVSRLVAVKTIKADASKDQTARKRFFYEASITADLDHPNIPPIYELGVSGEGIVFYSMKLIAGSEWQKVIRSRSLAENLEIFNRVADALAFAHAKHIIHRDLKPDNVIVGNYGEVYVTDWGLAVDIRSNPRVPFGGTPDYMAPEMASDKRDGIGKHSDIYLLGAILFQILTGKSPHAGRNQRERLNLAVANKFVETDCKDPLLNVALRAMNTQPEDRYGSVAEMQAAIREILAHNDSIELTNRSADLARTAAETKNYDTFNRAIFGFRGAIDLWGENDLAKQGLQDARISYGLCALDRGNYELALQTLDEKNPRETAIYEKAKKAKIAIEQKDARFKLFRRVAAAIGAVLLLMLSGATMWAYQSQQSALSSAVSEKVALQKAADEAKGREEEAKGREEAQAKLVIAAKAETVLIENAQKAREATLAAEEKARLEKQESDRKIAEQQQKARDDLAEAEKLRLMTERNAALEKQRDAELSAAKISLASQPQKFNLAVSQIRQNDIQSANILLEQIRNSKLEALEGNTPNFNNWAADRIALLSNADLPKQSLGGPVTAIDFAPTKNVGIAGNSKGDVILLQFEQGKLAEKNVRKSLGARIQAVVIAPDASLAIIATESEDKKHELYQWNLASTSEPTRISETENRSFQGLRFSPDGRTVLAGINQGLWAKTGNSDWKKVSSSEKENVRGELIDIVWTSPTQSLVLARLNNAKYLHLVDVATGGISKLDVPTNETERMTSLASVGANRLVIGSSDGRIETAILEGSKLAEKKELPRRHQVSVDRISNSGSGKLITRGKEPIAHVWAYDEEGNVQYETFLTGAPGEAAEGNNIEGTAFIDTNNMVAVDTAGNAVAINVERQKQRRQLTRRSAKGIESYPTPVVGVFSRGTSSMAIAVNQDGIIDQWNLQTGETISTKDRWSYFGHTPGAVIVDSQVDSSSGIVITAATLRDAKRSYLSDPSHFHEFCFWDSRTGNMIRRWTDAGSEFSQPRISIIEPGKLLTSSKIMIDYSTITSGGEVQFPVAKNLTDKSPEFSIINPKNPKVVAMLSPSGALFLWDKLSEIRSREEIGSREERPLQAVWSEDGERLYVVVNNGKIFRSTLAANGFQKPEFVISAKKGDSRLVTSHHDIDLLVESTNGQDSLYCAIRTPDSTGLLTCTVSKDGKASNDKREESKELAWLDSRSKKLTSQFGSQAVNRRQKENIVSASRIGNQVYVTTKREGVFQFTNDDVAKLVGLQSFVGSTADREGKFVWTLRSDGSVLRFAVEEGEAGKWERLPYSFVGARRLEASPDGKLFAVLGKDTLDLVTTSDGKMVEQVKSIIDFAWNPKEDQSLGMLTADGGVFVRGTAEQIGKVSVEEDSVRSVGFFEESWSDPAQKANRYFLVHSEVNERGKVHFVPLDAKKDGEKQPEMFVGDLPKGSRVAISPKDSLLATGDTTGAIRIWFASPAYQKMDALYDLESERDASIRQIVFADEGDTLVTSDEKSRLVGWLSKDKWTFAKP